MCNSIQFQLTAMPLFTHACHCSSCQKITGSAFAMSTFFLATDLDVLAGEAFSIEQPTNTGSRNVFLCPACQTVVWAESSDQKNVMIIRSGVFSDKTAIQPDAHIWTRRRQSWLALGRDTPQFAGNYVRSETWPQTSLMRIET